jgi:DNA replication and repair protein RecF
MHVHALTLSDFRSYKKHTFGFTTGATLVVGENATGKTNILEALMMAATGKSFRAVADRDVVRLGTELAKITAEVVTKNDTTSVSLYVTQGILQGEKAPIKKFLVNGISRRSADMVGTLKVVLFWPQDLDLITDSPSMRRKYLDTVLSQTDEEYRRSLVSYEKGLRQRNMLLDRINKQLATRSQLLFWDQLLIKAGGYITQ